MSTEIKSAFLNSLVARASYADIESAREIGLIASDSNQSQMTAAMADYFQRHFEFYLSSIDRDDGYAGIVFKQVGQERRRHRSCGIHWRLIWMVTGLKPWA